MLYSVVVTLTQTNRVRQRYISYKEAQERSKNLPNGKILKISFTLYVHLFFFYGDASFNLHLNSHTKSFSRWHDKPE